jgi:hypothetical protein
MRLAQLLVVTLIGCATAPATKSVPVASSAETPSFAGSYTLSTAEGFVKECGGQSLHLAAKHLRVSGEKAFADVVDRTYSARFEGDTMTADGDFDVEGICPGTKVYEKWTLTREASGALRGELESHWSIPPDCQRACEVRFPITATPD